MKLTLTQDDGTTEDFFPQSYTDAALAAAAVVPVAEVAKVETEVAAVDAELKADELATV